MDLAEYQKRATQTYIVNDDHRPVERLARLALGLCGESGEFAEKVKKIMRGDVEYVDAINDLEQEVGDVLWYLAVITYELLGNLDQIAAANLEKLKSRQVRGKIRGSGDNR